MKIIKVEQVLEGLRQRNSLAHAWDRDARDERRHPVRILRGRGAMQYTVLIFSSIFHQLL